MFFDKYDEGKKGWLTLFEAKDFFAYILDLNYKQRDDRDKFKNIVHLADPEKAKVLLKHRVLEFFRMGGFVHMDALD